MLKKIKTNSMNKNDMKEIDDELNDNINDDSNDDSIIFNSEYDDEMVEIEIDEIEVDIDEMLMPEITNLSKHTLGDKHRLKHDIIFKGKKETPLDENEIEIIGFNNDNLKIDRTSRQWIESVDNTNYINDKKVKMKVYEVLSEHTDIVMSNSRRKPSKSDFNNYFSLLKKHLSEYNFTNSELFDSLTSYFSDNLTSMFELLNQEYKNMIIVELKAYTGNTDNYSSITNINLRVGVEVKYNYNGGEVNGKIIEVDYANSIFTIDSYHTIKKVQIKDIIQIVNPKLKYNINKIQDTDFI